MKQLIILIGCILLSHNVWAQQDHVKVEHGKLLLFDARINQWVDPYYDVMRSTQPNRFPAYHEQSGTVKEIKSYQINSVNKEECFIAYEGQGEAILYARSFNPFTYKYEWKDITPSIVREKKASIKNIVVVDSFFKQLKVLYENGETALIKL